MLAAVASLYGGQVGDAGPTSLADIGVEPGSEDLLRKIPGKGAVGQAQDVGVIPHPGACRLAGIRAEGSADTGYFVRGHADTCSSPAEKNALIAVAARYRFGGVFGGQRPGDLRTSGDRAEGHHLVTVLLEPLPHGGVYRVGLVRTEGDAHATSLPPGSNQTS